MLLMSYEAPAGLGSGMMLLPGKGGGAACLLEHTFAMRQCLPRESPEAGVPTALLALLLPANRHPHPHPNRNRNRNRNPNPDPDPNPNSGPLLRYLLTTVDDGRDAAVWGWR